MMSGEDEVYIVLKTVRPDGKNRRDLPLEQVPLNHEGFGDHYVVCSNMGEAKMTYERWLDEEDTYSAHICVCLESTDYNSIETWRFKPGPSIQPGHYASGEEVSDGNPVG